MHPDQESPAARASGQHPPRDLAQAAPSWACGGSGDLPGRAWSPLPLGRGWASLRPHARGQMVSSFLESHWVCTLASCLGGGETGWKGRGRGSERVGLAPQAPGAPAGGPRVPTRPPGPALQPGSHRGQPNSPYTTQTPRSSAPAQASATHNGLKSGLGPPGVGVGAFSPG